MIDREAIDALRQRAEEATGPVLTAYVLTDPSLPANAAGAWATRLRNALKEAGVPASLASRVLGRLQSSAVRARTLVVVATDDWMEQLPLQVDLPTADLRHGRSLVRYGAPYLTPLLQVLDEHARYGVLLMDAQRWRLFEVFAGEIEERADAFGAIDTSEWRRLEESMRGVPQGVPARGGAGKDLFERRKTAWMRRFYRRVIPLLEQELAARGIDRIVVLGPDAQVNHFVELLPRRLRDRVVARAPGLPTRSASPGEVLERVAPLVERLEQQEHARLIDRVLDHGTHGVEATLQALQQGRLHAVVAPADVDQQVWRGREHGIVAATREQVEALGDAPEPVDLLAVLPELAESYAVRLDLVRGPDAERVRAELGGMGGLLRW